MKRGRQRESDAREDESECRKLKENGWKEAKNGKVKKKG